MTYQEARRLRGTGLFNLAAQNIASGGGVVGSLGSAISSKFKAKVTGIKEKFDPLNIAKKLTGNFGAAVLGKITGRSQKDIQYFSGGKRYGSSEGVTQDSNLDAIQPALYTKVAEGQRQRMKKGESVTDVLGKLYNLIKKGYNEDENYRDHDIKDKLIKNKRDEKWHKELMEAILGKKVKKNVIRGKITGANLLMELLDKLNHLKKIAEDALTRAAEKRAAQAATEKAAKEAAEKVAAKQVEEQAAKELEKKALEEVAQKATSTTAEKTAETAVKVVDEKIIEKSAEKTVAKLATKSIFESVPIAGALVGAAFAVPKMISGDYTGAALEVAGGAGGLPTAAAAGIIQGTREVYKDVYGNFPEKDDPKVAYDRLVQIKNIMQTVAEKSGNQRIKNLTEEAPESLQKDVDVNKAAFGYVRPAIRPKKSSMDQSTSVQTKPLAIPEPPPAPIGQKAQDVINQNNNLQMENQKPKVINVDNSKNVSMSGGNSGGGLVSDNTVSVRNEDTSLQKTQRQNLRPV